jgi:putative ABC transport system substrate-binding protein
VTNAEDLTNAFSTIIREQAEALLILPTPVLFTHRAKIAEFAIQQRLPSMGPTDTQARDGLLMSYGYDNTGIWHLAGSYVDRIFKGANPAELPVEQVDRFKLVINQKTAHAIGFDVTSLLSRADEVIE